MKKHLLGIANSWALGGAETLLLNLAQGMAEQGVSVTLALPPDAPAATRASEMRLAWLPLSLGSKISTRNKLLTLGRTAWDFFRLWMFLKRFRKDHGEALVLFQFKKEQFLGTLAARLLRLPVIWIEHGPLPRPLTQSRWAGLYLWAANRAKGIVAVSEAVRASLRQTGVRTRIEVIYPGVPRPFFEVPSPLPAGRQAPPLSPRRPRNEFLTSSPPLGGEDEGEGMTVGVAARLLESKGIDDFLRAAAIVQKQAPEVSFLIAGDGPDRPRLERLAEELGLGRTKFLGFRSDIPAITRRLDIVVSPTRAEGEGMPLRILEAMASGRAVVATDVGGSAEALDSGACGILVPPGDPPRMAQAILALLQNPEHSRALGQRAQARCEKSFSIPAMIDQWMRFLEEAAVS